MIRTRLNFLFAFAILVLSGCGSNDPVPVTELSEIVGSWKGAGQVIAMKILPDGSFLQALTLSEIEEGEYEELDFVFEDGQIIVVGLESYCGEEDGVYEAQLLSSGNLEFIVVDDDCTHRIGHLLAESVENEWARVE